MTAGPGAWDGRTAESPAASFGQPWPGVETMVTETVVEQVVQALARGEGVSAIARAYGLDRKTVRAWGRSGAYVERAARLVVSQLDPYRARIAQRAPEVDFNATVLHRELCEQGFTGSVIIVRRAGVVDQAYLDQTSDPDAVLGRKIAIDASEVVSTAVAVLQLGEIRLGLLPPTGPTDGSPNVGKS
jgi:hypothetical protein